MAGKHDRAVITRLDQLGPMASTPVASDPIALRTEQRQSPALVEDRVPHGANVGAERVRSGPRAIDWHTPVADLDTVVTNVAEQRVTLVVR